MIKFTPFALLFTMPRLPGFVRILLTAGAIAFSRANKIINSIRRLLLITALCSTAGVAISQENWTNTPTANVALRSEALDRNVRLQIGIPPNYDEADHTYNVIYCLDGFVNGGSIREIARYLQMGNEMPEAIIVCIDLEGNTAGEWFKERSFILTPTKSDSFAQWGISESWTGGGPTFLKALKEEIVPYIDKSYRTTPNERTIVGHSFGGLFASYVLFESPELFNRYLISSPSLPWDAQFILKHESQYAADHKDLGARVFLSVGELENEPNAMIVDDLRELAEILSQRNYPSLELTSMVFDDESHMSVWPSAYSRGLRTLFTKN